MLNLLMYRLNMGFKGASQSRGSIPLKYNQQDAMFSRSIYFYKLLYMFQAVATPIIRSTKLYIQRQVLSNQYRCPLLSWMRWNVSSISSTTVPPPIIRSTKLCIQRQVLSDQYCCLLFTFHLIHDSSRQQYWFDNT
jgi:hypothetical protein